MSLYIFPLTKIMFIDKISYNLLSMISYTVTKLKQKKISFKVLICNVFFGLNKTKNQTF